MAEANQHGLNAGFETFKKGFTEAGLASVPNDFQDQITRLGYASYGDFIMARSSSDSKYWAPEIRQERLKMILVPYIYGIISKQQEVMARELEFRVRNPDDSWTHDKAQDFARTKAGKLLLALFGDIQPGQ